MLICGLMDDALYEAVHITSQDFGLVQIRSLKAL